MVRMPGVSTSPTASGKETRLGVPTLASAR